MTEQVKGEQRATKRATVEAIEPGGALVTKSGGVTIERSASDPDTIVWNAGTGPQIITLEKAIKRANHYKSDAIVNGTLYSPEEWGEEMARALGVNEPTPEDEQGARDEQERQQGMSAEELTQEAGVAQEEAEGKAYRAFAGELEERASGAPRWPIVALLGQLACGVQEYAEERMPALAEATRDPEGEWAVVTQRGTWINQYPTRVEAQRLARGLRAQGMAVRVELVDIKAGDGWDECRDCGDIASDVRSGLCERCAYADEEPDVDDSFPVGLEYGEAGINAPPEPDPW